ncbi:MAG: hypothetical protein JSS82_12815 [Bacteroidetes bacterium]|nr:hypothetical protein [Bacteroidota bacterium]
MARISFIVLLLMAIFSTAGAQTGKKSSAPKKVAHKKTVVTKTVVINDEEQSNDEDEVIEEGEMPGEVYYTEVDEDGDGYYVEEPNDDESPAGTGSETERGIHRAIRHTASHARGPVYSKKYPENLYYFNAKTGFYYKRKTPLKK